MKYWATIKRNIVNFQREWGTFIYLSVAGGLFLHFVENLSWSLIGHFVLGLYLARGFADESLYKWAEKNMSPGTEGGLSPLYPRVWTFHLDLTKTFIEEITAKSSGKRDSLVAHAFSHYNDDEFLTKLESIPEQRSFLRSCIRRVIAPGESQGSPVRGTTEYTLPLAPKELRGAGAEAGSSVSAEVLPFVRVGLPLCTRDRTFKRTFRVSSLVIAL